MLASNGHLIRKTYFWWMNANRDSGAIGLFALNTFNVNGEFSSVALNNFAGLLAFEVSSGDHDFVIFAYWYAANVVLLAQLFAQWCTHNLTSDMRWSSEVSPTVLPSSWWHKLIEFHFQLLSKFLFQKLVNYYQLIFFLNLKYNYSISVTLFFIYHRLIKK